MRAKGGIFSLISLDTIHIIMLLIAHPDWAMMLSKLSYLL